jgi:hypothetical protein
MSRCEDEEDRPCALLQAAVFRSVSLDHGVPVWLDGFPEETAALAL